MFFKPKILVLHDKSGCGFWRTYQFAKCAQQEGMADIRLMAIKSMDQAQLTEALQWCDIVHIRGLVDEAHLETMLRYQHAGLKVATDYDDFHFEVSPWNKHYRDLGLNEVTVKDPSTGEDRYLWKDGIDGFNLKRNMKRFETYKANIQRADLITTTTVYLKDRLSSLSGDDSKIKVIPNAIDFTQWKPLDGIRNKFKDSFRFGWAVSGSHAEDMMYIRPAISKFLETNPETKFVCIGDTNIDITTMFPKGQVEWHPFSDLWEMHYPLRMAMLGLDVAIAPLANTEFNRCKSPLKYAEYTAFGWPTIAQNMSPYQEVITNGETGLLASSIDSWVSALETMYRDKDLRRKLHFNAMFTLKELFELKKVTREWVDIYKEAISGEKVNA